MSNFSNIVKEKFLNAVTTYNMFDNTKEIVVGFSGGADSVCLLHVLNTYKNVFGYSLKAVHVNHGIRGKEAEDDEKFAKEFCSGFDIPFFAVHFDCITEAQNNKESVEECGRRIRYKSFNSLCSKQSKIATAHNANDNAETIVFNITRGTSVKGLCGIPFVRDNIIRPLLLCSRVEIEGYCTENFLDYVTDSTNLSVDYTRNKIRHLVLPVLEEINPSFIDAFNSLSSNAETVSSFLSFNATKLMEQAKKKDFLYDRTLLLDADKAIVNEIFCSEFYEYCGLKLDNKKVNSLYNLLTTGGRLQLYGNIHAEVKKDYLRFYTLNSETKNEIIQIKNFPFEAFWGDYFIQLEEISNYSKIVNQFYVDDVIDCNTISGNLVLRTRREGDSFTFFKRNVTKSLKKLFNEENVPVELRDKIPVISDEIGVVWVFGFGVTKRCTASKDSDNIILVRGKNNDR